VYNKVSAIESKANQDELKWTQHLNLLVQTHSLTSKLGPVFFLKKLENKMYALVISTSEININNFLNDHKIWLKLLTFI
jgi:hypothetical protein